MREDKETTKIRTVYDASCASNGPSLNDCPSLFFLLSGTICHHFLKYELEYPKFVEKLLEDLYLDDATSGANTVTEGKEFYDLAKSIMLEAGFDL